MNNYEKSINDLIDRYIYQVTKRLPESQRADIEQELRGLIDDMLEGKSYATSKDDVIAVMRELGQPSELAAKYNNTKRWLIGPAYFDMYLTVLKIVPAVSAFGVALAQVIGYISEPPQNIYSAIGLIFASIFSAAMQAFAWVTGIFALVEHFAKEMPEKNDWNPAELPPVPEDKAKIKRSEPIVGIIFTVIFLVIINTMPQLFNVYNFTDIYIKFPVFDLDVFYLLLPFIDVMICIGLAKELLRLVAGRYTVSLCISLIVLNIISMLMFVWLFGPLSGIWNADFLNQVGDVMPMPDEVVNMWSYIPKIMVGFCIFGTIVDSIKLLVKIFRDVVTPSA